MNAAHRRYMLSSPTVPVRVEPVALAHDLVLEAGIDSLIADMIAARVHNGRSYSSLLRCHLRAGILDAAQVLIALRLCRLAEAGS